MLPGPAWIAGLVLAAGLAGSCAGGRAASRSAESRAPALVRCEDGRPRMGTLFRVVVYAPDAARGAEAIDAAFARIDELDAIFSDFAPESELRRLCARTAGRAGSGAVPVSEELFTVLAAACEWSQRSGGAFDATVGPYVRLWRRSARQGELPSPERMAVAARSVGRDKIRLDAERRTVELLASDVAIDLGGIAKGYALDECLRVLRARGIESALIDGGGDVALGAPPPGRAGWRIALAPFGVELAGARDALELANAALATSGDAHRYVEIAGRRYSHLIDPATGLGLTRRTAATVIAGDALTADALSSAACVMPPEAALTFLASLPGVEGRIAHFGDAAAEPAPRILETPGFARHLRPADMPAGRASGLSRSRASTWRRSAVTTRSFAGNVRGRGER